MYIFFFFCLVLLDFIIFNWFFFLLNRISTKVIDLHQFFSLQYIFLFWRQEILANLLQNDDSKSYRFLNWRVPKFKCQIYIVVSIMNTS